MNCEICGKPIYGKPITIEVDGAYLKVCDECAKYGKVVNEKKKLGAKEVNVNRVSRNQEEEEYELIDGYGRVIKEMREKMNLTQEQLGRKIGIKPSLLAKIEQEKIMPDYQTLRKIEFSLKVKLRK
ncbi:MAG: multiprotein bridging factor aMBF1 [Nitrososphaeria archaeon]|nr:multiprotein bridging factor aMBF1 [Conexivisphaerales archaeon]